MTTPTETHEAPKSGASVVFTIYCHTHVATGRRYVGLTKLTVRKRWNQHVYFATKKTGKGCRRFWNAIRKYGKDAFSHEVLERCSTLEVANLAEQCWIELYNSCNPEKGFNIQPGGRWDHPKDPKNPWDNPGFREKVVEARKASWQDPVYRSMMTGINREIQSRPEVKEKIGSALRGRPISQERKDHLSSIHKGKKRDPEVVARIQRTLDSPEYRERQSRLHKGRVHSEETRAKGRASNRSSDPGVRARISASARSYWAKKKGAVPNP
jgi:hypothetical protein